MATNRTRRRRNRIPEVSPECWALLNDEPLPAAARKFHVWALENDCCPWFSGGLTLRGAWEVHGGEIVERWAADHPGTRPSCWWRFSAPRLTRRHPIALANPEAFDAHLADLPMPRDRVGGTGTPGYERLCLVPQFHLGLPVGWIDAGLLRTYDLINAPLDVPAYDPLDPPTYESQASFLRRLNLLLPGEARRLPADAFEPEAVTMGAANDD